MKENEFCVFSFSFFVFSAVAKKFRSTFVLFFHSNFSLSVFLSFTASCTSTA